MSTLPSRSLKGDLRDLALVAGGAIPGALLRWQLGADVVANMLGCLLLGVVLAQASQRKRLMLWAGIGFCGSLTTFCTWMLDRCGQRRRNHRSRRMPSSASAT
jgi:CrcB protein